VAFAALITEGALVALVIVALTKLNYIHTAHREQ